MRTLFHRHRTVVLVGAATAFSLLGDQALYSVLPVYYESLGLTPVEVGILLSANRWIRLLTNELAHRLDSGARHGRALFVGAFALGATTTAAYAFSHLFAVLLLARLAWGLAWSFIRHQGVGAVMADAPDGQAGRTMGLYNGISRAGSVAGLLGGAILVDVFGFSAGVLMLAGISLASLPLGATGYHAGRPTQPASRTRPPASLLVLGITLGAVGPGFVMGTLGAVIAGYVPAGPGLTAATLTGALLGTRYLMDSAAAPWLGAVFDRLGLRTAAITYLTIGAFALLAAASKPTLVVFMATIVVFFTCGTGLQAGVAATASQLGSGAYARYVTASDFGSASGPLVGWMLVAWLDDPAWSLAAGGGVLLASAFAGRRLPLRRIAPEPARDGRLRDPTPRG